MDVLFNYCVVDEAVVFGSKAICKGMAKGYVALRMAW
jgi:hypothetical protein